MGGAPEQYLERMLGAIVGIEIAVTCLEGKFKLGQNKISARSRRGHGPADAHGFRCRLKKAAHG